MALRLHHIQWLQRKTQQLAASLSIQQGGHADWPTDASRGSTHSIQHVRCATQLTYCAFRHKTSDEQMQCTMLWVNTSFVALAC